MVAEIPQQAKENSLNVETILIKRKAGCPVIDVRSPAEFAKGHIPGSVNMPLFNNEERALVGTLYARSGKEDAISGGLKIIGPKLKDFASQGITLARDHEIIVYCWRGGMRSSSIAWLFETIGIKASVIKGGYKAYRTYIHEYLSGHFNFIVIGGMTGCGKTEILTTMERMGYPVVDLEGLASHKGSVFGAIGEPDQPTTEQFENNLFEKMVTLKDKETCFIEDESISIGSVFLPESFHRQMLECPLISLVVPHEERITRLVDLYAHADKDILIGALKRIEKRVGTEDTKKAVDHIRQENFREAISIVLKYYDKVYNRTLKNHHAEEKTLNLELHNNNIAENVLRILTCLNQKKLL